MAAALGQGSPVAASPMSQGGMRTVLLEQFATLDTGLGSAWGWQTAAYANCTDNPDSWKRDRLTPSSLSVASGHLTVTATHRDDGQWNTGLITTGDSCDSGGSGVQARTGDLVTVHVRLPAADSGAWPCLWTWRDGGSEVDLFEWYADRPDQIEFVNHVRSGSTVYADPAVGAGKWVYIAVRLDTDNDTWYVGTTPDRLTEVWSDSTGVGPDFSAYLILNLSISDGSFHHPPTGIDPVSMEVDLLRIDRPAPIGHPGSGGEALPGHPGSILTRIPLATVR
ncbi:beta-glucanase [Kitasatospora sp. NPDC048365]|uniref:beta-glucanase n=1 Tax=Kitasatospora sp. NPDC048365 TaxID=3364050 RepID=UPI0037181642